MTSIGAITLFVDDPQRSKAFYERALDLETIFEDENSAVLKLDNTILNFLQRGEAPGLVEPAAVAEADTGSQLQFTIWVDDADASCAQLAERGVALLNGPVDRPWGVRTAAFADPDGFVWEVAQQLG
jgi:catechol 2,3-dioxygenase-like lactoylglutathione lyase family enzyme